MFVNLNSTTIRGHKTYTLTNPDGSENMGFSLYRDLLLKKRRGLALETINAYLRATAYFFDYLHAFVLANGDNYLTEDLIAEAIDYWDEYLVEGERSDDDIVINVCKYLPSPNASPNTSAIYHSGLKNFLVASNKLRRTINSLHEKGLLKDAPIHSKTKLIKIPKPEQMPQKQRAAVISKSVLAGVIKGGANFATPGMFPQTQGGDDSRPYKDFPYDKIHALLKALPNDRDRALYAFIAASGCRIHEALRILRCDIDLDDRSVVLVNPNDRINDGHYDSFSTAQRKEIAKWKGRQIEATFLLEPFKSLFFKYAALYYKHKKPHDVDHEFIFCCTDRDDWGKPFLFATPSSIREGFNKAKKEVLGPIKHRLGPHSLRHTYGYFMKNFCPRVDGGYGLDLHLVQTLMGHADINSTKRYAEYDKTLAEMELAYANALVYDLNENRSVNEIRHDILLAELEQANKAIALEAEQKKKQLEAQDI